MIGEEVLKLAIILSHPRVEGGPNVIWNGAGLEEDTRPVICARDLGPDGKPECITKPTEANTKSSKSTTEPEGDGSDIFSPNGENIFMPTEDIMSPLPTDDGISDYNPQDSDLLGEDIPRDWESADVTVTETYLIEEIHQSVQTAFVLPSDWPVPTRTVVSVSKSVDIETSISTSILTSRIATAPAGASGSRVRPSTVTVSSTSTPKDFECNGLRTGKYLDRNITANAIESLCSTLEDPSDTTEGTKTIVTFENPSDSLIEGQVDQIGSNPNQARIKIKWESPNNKPSRDTCIHNLRDRVLDSCDDADNALNWKGGGRTFNNDVEYILEPVNKRAAISQTRKLKCRFAPQGNSGEFIYQVWGYGWGAGEETKAITSELSTRACLGESGDGSSSPVKDLQVKYKPVEEFEFTVRFGIIVDGDATQNCIADAVAAISQAELESQSVNGGPEARACWDTSVDGGGSLDILD
ncbi:hypothetical protein ABW19_dt0202095 [Dactylella cylindrospora]|nr:hypothetical protein ABW19_dt0202095 [Dactylella cylindrospora]